MGDRPFVPRSHFGARWREMPSRGRTAWTMSPRDDTPRQQVWINAYSFRNTVPTSDAVSYDVEVAFLPATMMVDVQLEHATKASHPSARFRGEQGWYFHRGREGRDDRRLVHRRRARCRGTLSTDHMIALSDDARFGVDRTPRAALRVDLEGRKPRGAARDPGSPGAVPFAKGAEPADGIRLESFLWPARALLGWYKIPSRCGRRRVWRAACQMKCASPTG